MGHKLRAVIVWFRQDLRLEDNAALIEASRCNRPIVPAYIWAPQEEGEFPPGAASRWWLHHSLVALDAALRNIGSQLVVRDGETLATLLELIEVIGADTVYWNRRYEPASIRHDREIKSKLRDRGIDAVSFNGALLIEPWDIATQSGEPYKVFTPFYKKVVAKLCDFRPQTAPDRLKTPARWPESSSVDDLGLLPSRDWAAEFANVWAPGCAGAMDRFNRFADGCHRYSRDRDRPDVDGTSRLSPHLHFGEISRRQVFARLCGASFAQRRTLPKRTEPFLRQLVWREFAHHLLYHFPDTTCQPMLERFARFPWSDESRDVRAWQRGQTGYPIVDAGMRQLWATGWMHNRVRMVVASFLTKHLLIDWRVGADWFWDTLVDADLANNTLGWQWVAGCGADAAPYFRIFNPVRQGVKFDPSGDYVRTWVPELTKLPDKWIHHPFDAPASVLDHAGVLLGDTYPRPIVDHAEARQRALAAYESVKTAGVR